MVLSESRFWLNPASIKRCIYAKFDYKRHLFSEELPQQCKFSASASVRFAQCRWRCIKACQPKPRRLCISAFCPVPMRALIRQPRRRVLPLLPRVFQHTPLLSSFPWRCLNRGYRRGGHTRGRILLRQSLRIRIPAHCRRGQSP